MKKLISVIALIVSTFSIANALECPKAPEQIKKDWETEVSAAVLRIGPVKGAELKAKTKRAAEDLLGKLPDAGKIYLEQMMFSAYCTALRDDKKMTESEKAKLLKEYRKDVIPTVKKASSKSQKAKLKPQNSQSESKDEKSTPVVTVQPSLTIPEVKKSPSPDNRMGTLQVSVSNPAIRICKNHPRDDFGRQGQFKLKIYVSEVAKKNNVSEVTGKLCLVEDEKEHDIEKFTGVMEGSCMTYDNYSIRVTSIPQDFDCAWFAVSYNEKPCPK